MYSSTGPLSNIYARRIRQNEDNKKEAENKEKVKVIKKKDVPTDYTVDAGSGLVFLLNTTDEGYQKFKDTVFNKKPEESMVINSNGQVTVLYNPKLWKVAK